jgi:thioredoxin reductase (NADPH)
MESLITLGVAALLFGAFVIPYYRRVRRREEEARRRFAELKITGLHQASAMHPQIDALACIGCGSCVRACPEEDVIGVINGKATLVHGSKCVGHGLCAEACPVGAITLVMAAPGRSAVLPILSTRYETTLPNIFIAGELGGMGLIRNAVLQGTTVVNEIGARPRPPHGMLDCVIVGAGPAGLTAALRATELGLRFVIIEQGDIGGTIYQYPRRKIVLTSPVDIPVWGTLRFREVSKESLLEVWEAIIRKAALEIRTEEKMVDLHREGDVHLVVSSKETYRTRNVVLALGRRGTPRKLGIPGEALSKVTYRLIDAASYQDTDCLVVGGGDSAVEAAVALALQGTNRVTLSYRQAAFGRIKTRNQQHLDEQVGKKRIVLAMESEVAEIRPDSAILRLSGTEQEIKNDAVIISIGGEMPFALLERLGIGFHREAIIDTPKTADVS